MSTNGETYDIDGIDTAGEGGTEPPATEPAPARPSTAVDLAAWGRGQQDYIFGEVKLAIDEHILGEIYKIVDARYVSVQSRADAVKFLIDEGIISSAEARTDV